MYKTYKDNEKTIIYPEGNLFEEESENLRLCIIDLINTGEKHLCFDLSNVEIMCSSALLIFLVLSKQVNNNDISYEFIKINPSILDLLKVGKIIKD